MTESVERAREHRASLRSAMSEVESALAAPTPGREPAWRRELTQQLQMLEEALQWHVAATEGDDGLLGEILAAAPRLAHRIQQARGDHARIAWDLRQAIEAVPSAPVSDLREQIVTVLGQLVRHRQLGSDLVYEAFTVDIEAAD